MNDEYDVGDLFVVEYKWPRQEDVHKDIWLVIQRLDNDEYCLMRCFDNHVGIYHGLNHDREKIISSIE